MAGRKPTRLRIDVPFEDALKRILKAGPMPAADKPKRKARRKRSAKRKPS
jgi:hypothetical protein